MNTVFGGRNRRPPRRQGYVLIMTLVLIAIAALSMTGLARRSLQMANEAIEAQARLQRHWGAASCRRLLLDRAEEIFLALEEEHVDGQQPWPAPRWYAAQVHLAGLPYRFWLTDENAKLNLNSLTARLPEKRREMLHQLSGLEIPLRLRPDLSPAAERQQRWFSSWGQVANVPDVCSSGQIDSLLETFAEFTCWGNGKLNIRRTSDQSLLLVSSKLVNQQVGQKLLEARAQATELEFAELLKTLALRRRDELALRRWLTDRSTCYCLWLEMDDGQRKWYHQWIQGDPAAQDSVLSFRW